MAKHVIVVGGGIVGCMTALKLAELGCQVTVVERNIIAAQTSGESSWAGAGILFPLLPWFYKEEVNTLSLAGASLYPALCQYLLDKTGIDPEYTVSGMLIQPPFDKTLADDWCKKNNIQTQRFQTQYQDDNLLLPQVAQVRPPHLLKALKHRLIQKNVTLLEQTQLEPLQQTTHIDGWKTNTGEVLAADAFVVTSGAWSFELLKDTAANLNIKPMRGQILLYKLENGQAPQNSLRHIVYRDGFYMVPRRDGYLLAGSTLEDVGFDPRTTEEVKIELQTKAEAIMPSLKHAPIIKHWSGLRPGTPDNMPTIAAHPSIQNLYMNTGHFRYGLTMAPESARRMAELINRHSREGGNPV